MFLAWMKRRRRAKRDREFVDHLYPVMLEQWRQYPSLKAAAWVVKTVETIEPIVGKKQALRFMLIPIMNEDGSLKADWQLDRATTKGDMIEMREYLKELAAKLAADMQ